MAKKVLIVEDETPMAHAFELKLKHAGYEPVVAGDGEEALAQLEKGGVDIMLLDLMMPKKNGFEVLEAMKEKKIEVPVIVTTNLSQQEDQDRVAKLGAKDYIVKSNTPLEEIIAKVKDKIGDPE